ncbi:MAG: hypothetical protein LAO77_16440 [Acidobacteriia bacterium]|nr:hypothetical protein [Terriglobia bacterium]
MKRQASAPSASVARASAPVWLRTQAALLALGIAVLFAQSGGQAQSQPPNALPFSKSFLVTGNYVVGGADFDNGSRSGFVTGTIAMRGVPANADILAAFLYWETLTNSPNLKDQTDGVKFRGQPVTAVKASSLSPTPATAACFIPGPQPRMTMFRADVLRLLPLQLDTNGQPTGKRLVNDEDLEEAGVPRHTVTLPDAKGSTNHAPASGGASLFVVYRDPTRPLTQIVLYDGIYLQPPSATMTQTIRGFFQSSMSHVAKVTHIVGSGKHNGRDRVWFDNRRKPPALIGSDTFENEEQGGKSDLGWSNPTFDVTSMMPGLDPNLGYGEEVVTTVDHRRDNDRDNDKDNQYDCLTWAAIAFSTTVQDSDGDGIPDKLEDVSGLKQPNNEPLPDLHAMGASSRHKDIFVEIGAMTADPDTGYGSINAPFNPATPRVVDAAGHSHLPTPDVLKLVGDAYTNAPVDNPDGSPGINIHFDAGSGYHGLPGYGSAEADTYLIPSTYARGGELIKEVPCAGAQCQFPDYPGTVSFQIGYQILRDAPVGPDGEELTPSGEDAQEASCRTPGYIGNCRRRFDHNRQGLFHYLLYAHARGLPKSTDPQSPDFHVPKSSSGVSNLPGGNLMVTLGLWDNFVGTPFAQATTSNCGTVAVPRSTRASTPAAAREFASISSPTANRTISAR